MAVDESPTVQELAASVLERSNELPAEERQTCVDCEQVAYKGDIRQINAICREFGFDRSQREQFKLLVEGEKRALGLGPGATLPYSDLRSLACEI